MYQMKTRTQSLYNCDAVENLINRYVERGGTMTTIREGTLGYGLTILHGDGLKTAIVTEKPINSWSSAHTIRMYNKMPAKYQKMLDAVDEELAL